MCCEFFPVADLSPLQAYCSQLQELAEEFVPGDALGEGLCWLSDTLRTAADSLISILEAWQLQAAFCASESYQVLTKQHPTLRATVLQLQLDIDELVQSCKSRSATHEQVLQPAMRVLTACNLQQQSEAGTTHQGQYAEHSSAGSLQCFTQTMAARELQPAVLNCVALQRLSVQLLILCCRLARCHQMAGFAALDEVAGCATAAATRLGLAEVVADMPYEAAEVLQQLKKLEQQLPHAATAVAGFGSLVLQCSVKAVAGPVALLQACDMQLHATGRAFLPASYLGLCFMDCLVAMKVGLFQAASEQLSQLKEGVYDVAEGYRDPLLDLQASVAAQHLSNADAEALCGLLGSFRDLMQLDVTVSPETALVISTGASERLDDFKSALDDCVELLLQGRLQLQSCCQRLNSRGELLQKEVLKAEVTLVGQGFRYQVST